MDKLWSKCVPSKKRTKTKQNKIVILVQIWSYFKNHVKLNFMLAELMLVGAGCTLISLSCILEGNTLHY
jgi:hypothetical protein